MGITLSSADLDAAIISRLPSLGKEQKAAVLNMLEAFSQVPDADHWDDPEFVAEMEQRKKDFEERRETMLTWEEVQASIANQLAEVTKSSNE